MRVEGEVIFGIRKIAGRGLLDRLRGEVIDLQGCGISEDHSHAHVERRGRASLALRHEKTF